MKGKSEIFGGYNMEEVKPIISFTIPTWNRAKELRECLDSIIPQILESNERVEIVISDNASTDDTSEIAKEYLGKYDFVRYFRNSENLGFDLNLISAVEKADGEYVWLFSDDDWLANGALEEIIHIISTYRPCFISTNFRFIVKDKEIDFDSHRRHMIKSDIDKCTIDDLFLYRTHFFTFMTSNILLKKLINIPRCRSEVGAYRNWIHVYMIAQVLDSRTCGYMSSYYAVLSRADNSRTDPMVFLGPMPDTFQRIFEQYNVHESTRSKVIQDIIRDFLTLQNWIAILVTNKVASLSRSLIVPIHYRILKVIPRKVLIFLWKLYRFLKGKGYSLPENINSSLEKDVAK